MVFEKAKELGELIASSKELERFKAAELKQQNDPEAVALVQAFALSRNSLMAEMNQENLSKEQAESIRKRLADESAALAKNPIVNEFMQALDGFQGMMSKINGIIAHYVSGEESSCGGSCGDCGGCH